MHWMPFSGASRNHDVRTAHRMTKRKGVETIVREDTKTESRNNTAVINKQGRNEELGDFTTTWRVVPISLLAIVIGVICAFVALALLRLIGLFTNLFYFGRWSAAMVSPAGNHLGVYSIFIPIAGALVIGVMAKYGSERIRGHGIPEAIESILARR